MLYTGEQGRNFERWGFWKRRFSQLREVVAADVARLVDEAMQNMTRVVRMSEELWKFILDAPFAFAKEVAKSAGGDR